MTAWIEYPVVMPDGSERHSTLIYLGETNQIHASVPTILNGLSRYGERPGLVFITELTRFGPENNIPVALLSNSVLFNSDDLLANLGHQGIRPASEFPYIPHVTLDGSKVLAGQTVWLDWPVLHWDDKLYRVF